MAAPQRTFVPSTSSKVCSSHACTAARSSHAAKPNHGGLYAWQRKSEQRYETCMEKPPHAFILQYFFPPSSVGEVGRWGAPGRREIGHGKLAEKALAAILPPKTDFPYGIRVESNITESNGSSSMATVCGGCLSMMDAGVPI